jgi:hypothetical protein
MLLASSGAARAKSEPDAALEDAPAVLLRERPREKGREVSARRASARGALRGRERRDGPSREPASCPAAGARRGPERARERAPRRATRARRGASLSGSADPVGRRKREEPLRVLRAARGKPGLRGHGPNVRGRRGAERLEERSGLLRIARARSRARGPRGRGLDAIFAAASNSARSTSSKRSDARSGASGHAPHEGGERPAPRVARLSRPREGQRAGDRGARETRVGLAASEERVAHGAPLGGGRRETRGFAESLAGENFAHRGRVSEERGDRRLLRGEAGGEPDPRGEAGHAERGAVEPCGEGGGRAVAAGERCGGGREAPPEGGQGRGARRRSVRREARRGEGRKKRGGGESQGIPLSPSARATRRARPRGCGRARP